MRIRTVIRKSDGGRYPPVQRLRPDWHAGLEDRFMERVAVMSSKESDRPRMDRASHIPDFVGESARASPRPFRRFSNVPIGGAVFRQFVDRVRSIHGRRPIEDRISEAGRYVGAGGGVRRNGCSSPTIEHPSSQSTAGNGALCHVTFGVSSGRYILVPGTPRVRSPTATGAVPGTKPVPPW